MLELRVGGVAAVGGGTIPFVVASAADRPGEPSSTTRSAIRGPTGRPGKVFKLATLDLAPGEQRALRRRHGLREVTTRVTRPGAHTVGVQVNGHMRAETTFELVRP